MLLIIAGYTHYSFYQQSSLAVAKENFEYYLKETEAEIREITSNEIFVESLLELWDETSIDNIAVDRATNLEQKHYTIFFYDDKGLTHWTNDKSPIPPRNMVDADNPYYVIHQNIYRLLRHQTIVSGKRIRMLSCIPIQLGASTEPYAHIDQNLPATLRLTTEPGLPIITNNGEDFLYIQSTNFERLTKREVRILALLYFLAFIAMAILIQKIASLVREKVGIWSAIGFFLFTIVGLRFVTYLFDFTSHFRVSEIFDPSITSPAFNISLGNIFLNILLILWVSVYLINRIDPSDLTKWGNTGKISVSFVGYFLIALASTGLAKFCSDLIQKTSIDFNFESVFNLDQISILSLIGIIFLLFTIFIWSAKIISIVQDFEIEVKSRVLAALGAIVVSLPFAYMAQASIPLLPFAMVVGIFILLLDLFLEVKTPNFTWIVLWLVVLSGFSSIMMFKYNRDKDIQQRTQIAQKLTEGIDQSALMEIELLIKSLEEPLKYAKNYEDVQQIVSGAFVNKTSSYLHTHYDLGFPKISELRGSREVKQNNHTYYKRSDDLDHYLFTVNGGQGFRVLTSLQKKKSNPYNPLPQFIPTTNFKNIPQLQDYEYAIYKHSRCVERSSAEYRMILEDDVPLRGDIRLIYPSGRSELIYNNGEYVTKIGRKLTGLIKPVSLFSYLFVIIVIIIFVLLMLNSVYPYLPSEFNFTLSNQISLRNKIQVSVLALIILSFIIIGIVTVFYFRSTAEKSYLDKLRQTASSLQYELQENIRQHRTAKLDAAALHEIIKSLAIKYNTHIQVFDNAGLLIETSDQEAVDAGVLKDRMSIPPLIYLKKFGESIYIHDQKESQRAEHRTAFFSLIPDQHNVKGFVGLPVFPGISEAANSVKDFMGTLLNVYVFLLLIAGAFALAVANSITRPMTVLGQKLKDFSLGKSNEPIVWKTKDELGLLIQEYNQMIVKLDESADLLAVTEREVAWREMAKQVAHEIKNPLTPMRLSIQHLQHAMQNADPIESRQLVQRVGITLIEQIDNLSRIAAEFSTFAKMPKPKYESIILNDLVASVHDLFKKRDDMDFNLYVPIDEIFVNADRSHLLRVLNNLIKNAIQAIPGSRRGVIDIRLEKKGDRAVILVSDNGKGISREMREKVFYPNFTTKTSGTGLGLAISKNIVESFGGRIYFETEEGIGTRFYFELPLLRTSHEQEVYIKTEEF